MSNKKKRNEQLKGLTIQEVIDKLGQPSIVADDRWTYYDSLPPGTHIRQPITVIHFDKGISIDVSSDTIEIDVFIAEYPPNE